MDAFVKEGFAILETFHRLDYLLMQDSLFFTDHRNLLLVFASFTTEPAIGRYKALKVLRWAVFLSQFKYRIEHVEGVHNIMADIITRWLRSYQNLQRTVKLVTKRLLQHDVVPSPLEDDFDRPNVLTIRNTQSKHISEKPSKAIRICEDIWTV